jgi:hypothetical protein
MTKCIKTKNVSCSLPLALVTRLDAFVIEGHLISRSDGITHAVEEYLFKMDQIRLPPPYPNLLTLQKAIMTRWQLLRPNHVPKIGNAFFIPETEAESK